MNCKIQLLLVFLIFCAAAVFAVKFIPQVWAGYGAMVLFLVILGTLFFGWIVSVIRHVRNPYDGAQNLRRHARRIARDESIDINTAIQQVWDEAKAKGETTPKRLESIARPVMVDKAHLNHIRHNEPIAKPGYDHPAAKDPERFGVVQQPELPAGKEPEGIQVDLQEKQHQSIKR